MGKMHANWVKVYQNIIVFDQVLLMQNTRRFLSTNKDQSLDSIEDL